MNGLDLGIGALERDMWRVVFLMTRIGATGGALLRHAAVPMSVRIAITGALAIFVSVWMPAVAARGPAFAGRSAGNRGRGHRRARARLRVATRFAAPTVAAELISGGMGMSMAVSQDAMGGGTTTSFGQYFVIVLTLIFLATGAHLHWIALVTESYNAFPPGQTWLGADRFAAIAGFASFMFETALRIAAGVILLLVQVLTGILSRSAPSLNLALGLRRRPRWHGGADHFRAADLRPVHRAGG